MKIKFIKNHGQLLFYLNKTNFQLLNPWKIFTKHFMSFHLKQKIQFKITFSFIARLY